MTYVNVGVHLHDPIEKVTQEFAGKHRIKTKAALKRLLAESPNDVLFDVTTLEPLHKSSDPERPMLYRGDTLREGEKYQVCGPDPYTRRNWWATVELVDGVPKVRN